MPEKSKTTENKNALKKLIKLQVKFIDFQLKSQNKSYC